MLAYLRFWFGNGKDMDTYAFTKAPCLSPCLAVPLFGHMPLLNSKYSGDFCLRNALFPAAAEKRCVILSGETLLRTTDVFICSLMYRMTSFKWKKATTSAGRAATITDSLVARMTIRSRHVETALVLSIFWTTARSSGLWQFEVCCTCVSRCPRDSLSSRLLSESTGVSLSCFYFDQCSCLVAWTGYMWAEIILKSFQPLRAWKLAWNYFKIISEAAWAQLKNIFQRAQCRWNNFEIFSELFQRLK